MTPSFRLGAIAPEDAIAAFQARKLLRPSFRWQDVWQAEHARAFAVAGVLRLDVLRTIRDQVDEAVANGTDAQDFRERLKAQLVAKGFWGNVEITDPASGEVRRTRFNEARLQLIFDVNMRQSHAAGRWARAQRSKMPYLVYRTMRDERVRVTHRHWDNVVLPKDHPWWHTHYPPNGWRCRCTAFATDEAGLALLRKTAPAGSPVRTTAPDTQWTEFENRSTGQVERVPAGIDPGFAYNPGQAHVAAGVELLERGLAGVRPTSARAGDALTVTRRVVERGRTEKAFRDFLAQPPDVDTGLPVAVLPAAGRAPAIASVNAQDLRAQAGSSEFPRPLPVTAAGWALAQAVIDSGERFELPGGVVYGWRRDVGGEPRLLVLELQRRPLVWWVKRLATLTVAEAVAAYPVLQALA